MPFGSKDLLTKALPHAGMDVAQIAKFCFFHTCICRWPTLCWITCPKFISICHQCSIVFSEIQGCQIQRSCGPGGSACDPTQFCYGSEPYVIQDLEDLVTVRAELNKTLKQLDAMEKEGLASGITSVEQADELEQTLKAQLDHLRKVRSGLK